jgi:8-oxo-dGTP pyrophosphatase MutT (NUDIX family)
MGVISCGVIIQDQHGRVLLGHMTNHEYWDFPKGKMEDGESEEQAAIRETKEEANIELDPENLVLLASNQPYRKGKRLSLFNYKVDEFSLFDIKCNSFVTGQNFTEFDEFIFVEPSEFKKYLSPAMNKYIETNNIIARIGY